MEWIKTEERLPEERHQTSGYSEKVLICNELKILTIGIYDHWQNMWKTFYQENTVTTAKPTHWQPLPKAPK